MPAKNLSVGWSSECIGDLGNSHKQLKSTFHTSCVHDYILKQQFSDAPCDPQTFRIFSTCLIWMGKIFSMHFTFNKCHKNVQQKCNAHSEISIQLSCLAILVVMLDLFSLNYISSFCY